LEPDLDKDVFNHIRLPGDLEVTEMIYISALSLVFGVAQRRKLSLSLLILFALAVATSMCVMSAASGHSVLHSMREAVYAAWSAEIGALAGVLLDRLVLHRSANSL
jgi:hypothetical protein